MTTLWFIIPAHGRPALSQVCFRQLERTCEELGFLGIRATAVVIADDENLEIAQDCGFATVEQSNQALGRKWNDGYELACRYGEADFCVPMGSDDWVRADFIAGLLPDEREIRVSYLSSVVSEDGRRMSRLRIPYEIGDGIRIIPAPMLKKLRYRPAGEAKKRAIDSSIMERIGHVKLRKFDIDPCQIVDWKSNEQLNSYDRCAIYREGEELDPFDFLRKHYPHEALEEMGRVYAKKRPAGAGLVGSGRR